MVSLFVVNSAFAEPLRPARYHAVCHTPNGVYDEDIYDYDFFRDYYNVKIIPLVGKPIIFIGASCTITEY